MASELKHTVTPAGQGGDYNTVLAALNHLVASHADLVSADVYASVEIGGDWTGVEEDGWWYIPATLLTDATRYLRIYTAAAARHDGKWDTGAYILHATGHYGVTDLTAGYVYIDGVQIQVTGVDATGQSIIMKYTSALSVISNCILRGDVAEDTYAQYGVTGTDGHVDVYNTIIYDIGPLGRCITNASPASTTVYSTTGIGGLYGLRRTSGTVIAKNCYFGGSASGDYNGTITKTTCASSDATGSTGLQTILVDTDTFVNVSAGTEDFHLAAGSPLIGVGTDTSGDAAPMNFTTDIDGDAR